MEGTQNKQAGFNIVELLVIIVAVGVIGVGGWFVYQHNRPKPTGATGGTQTTNQTTNQQSTTTTYFTITEWGVRAPYSGSLKLSYSISSDGKTATFSSDQLTALSSDCVGAGGSIVRYAPTDFAGPYEQGQTVSQIATAHPGTYNHIGAYYYIFRHSQSGCGDISTTATLQSETNATVQTLSSSLQAIPN